MDSTYFREFQPLNAVFPSIWGTNVKIWTKSENLESQDGGGPVTSFIWLLLPWKQIRHQLKVQMKLVLCYKFQVNRMNCVEGKRGGPIDPPPPLKASCNYFFLKASRVKAKIIAKAITQIIKRPKLKLRLRLGLTLKLRQKAKVSLRLRIRLKLGLRLSLWSWLRKPKPDWILGYKASKLCWMELGLQLLIKQDCLDIYETG